MDHSSPIKNWIHKHSPLKSRNKPLPPPPPEDSSSMRKPGEPVSGNTSPPKVKSTKKFLSLLKPKSNHTPASSPPNVHNQHTPIHKKTFRSAKGRTPDLRTVSKKISNLEAQLKEAQEELSVIAAAQTQAIYREGVDVDSEIVQRQESLSQGGRFDGLVENLLDQCNSSLRPVTRRGPSDMSRSAFVEYQQVEAAYEPVEVDMEGPQSKQLKRKRSEASWKEMQERIAEFQKQQQRQQPEIKKIKRTLDPPQYSQPKRQKNDRVLESRQTAVGGREIHTSQDIIEDENDDDDDDDDEIEEEEELTALPQIKSHPHHTRSSLAPTSALPSSVRVHHRTSKSPPKQQSKSATTPPIITTKAISKTQRYQQHQPTSVIHLTDAAADKLANVLTPLTPLTQKSASADNDTTSTTTTEVATATDTLASTVSAARRARNRRTHVFVPGPSTRLSKVIEEFEWNDEEIF